MSVALLLPPPPSPPSPPSPPLLSIMIWLSCPDISWYQSLSTSTWQFLMSRSCPTPDKPHVTQWQINTTASSQTHNLLLKFRRKVIWLFFSQYSSGAVVGGAGGRHYQGEMFVTKTLITTSSQHRPPWLAPSWSYCSPLGLYWSWVWSLL